MKWRFVWFKGFFHIGTSHTTYCSVKCGSYSTIPTNATYLCKYSLRKTFKALPQCEKHAVQFLIMKIYMGQWRPFTLWNLYTGHWRWKEALWWLACLHMAAEHNLEEEQCCITQGVIVWKKSFVLEWDRKTAEVFYGQRTFCYDVRR